MAGELVSSKMQCFLVERSGYHRSNIASQGKLYRAFHTEEGNLPTKLGHLAYLYLLTHHRKGIIDVDSLVIPLFDTENLMEMHRIPQTLCIVFKQGEGAEKQRILLILLLCL